MRRSAAVVAGVAGAVLALLVADVAAGGPVSTSVDPRVARHEAPVVAGVATTLAEWLADAGVWWRQGSVLLAVTALVLVVRRRRSDAVRVVVGLTALAAAVVGLKQAVGRIGPHDDPTPPYGGSFPSGHAATAVVVGFLLVRPLLGPGRRGSVLAGVAAAVWALLVGWSRVHLGVHWTSDVLGGWAVGAFVLAVTALVTGPDRPAGPAPRGIRVACVRRLGGRAEEWDALLDASPVPSPFLRSWWVDNVADGSANLLLVLDRDELVGGLALERARSLVGIERYRVLAGGPLCPDHLDLLARPGRHEEVVAALARWFRGGRPKILDLRGIRADADLLAVFPRAQVVVEDVAPYEPLAGVEEYVAARSGGFARRMRRRERQVAARGVLVREVGAAEVPGALADLADMHAGFPGRDALVAQMPRLAPAVVAGAVRGEVRMLVAEREGERGGVLLCFVLGGRLSLYQGCRRTSPEFADVGTVLDHRAITDACAAGLAEVDMLRGAEPYKATFTDHRRPLLRVRAASGRVARALLRGELLARRLVRRARAVRTGSRVAPPPADADG